MQGLLVIEQSLTLSNLLVRTLSAGGYPLTTVTQDLNQALRLLAESASGKRRFDAIVLGVPPRQANDIKPLLTGLAGEGVAAIPLLLVTHDRHSLLERWSAERGCTETIVWQSFSKIPGVLGRMLPEVPGMGQPGRPLPRAVRVLLVDDSHSARYAYRQLLEANGFPVEVAASIAEAREKLEAAVFDLAIVDYFLPDGTGDQLCRHLRDSPASQHTTLAIITGGYRESTIKKCLDAGAIEFMFKSEAKELFVARVTLLARNIEIRQSMQAEHQRLDGILASVGDGVYSVDPDGRLGFINPAAVRMLGYRAAGDLAGAVAAEALHYRDAGDSGSSIDLADYYANGEPLTAHQTLFRHATGQPLAVECTTFPLSSQSRRKGTVIIFRVIPERQSTRPARWNASQDSISGWS